MTARVRVSEPDLRALLSVVSGDRDDPPGGSPGTLPLGRLGRPSAFETEGRVTVASVRGTEPPPWVFVGAGSARRSSAQREAL